MLCLRLDMEMSIGNTLDLLRRELAFLDGGGYTKCSYSPWRAAYLFEESPSCPNYSDGARAHLCQDCWLMQFVPSELQDEQIPCRFVELTHDGATVDSLYRCGTQPQSEEALRAWLVERIRELEAELANSSALAALRHAS